MKVILFDGSGCPELTEGDVYTASTNPDCNETYILAEMDADPATGDLVSYFKWRFIPLSTIDETELLHNRQTELI